MSRRYLCCVCAFLLIPSIVLGGCSQNPTPSGSPGSILHPSASGSEASAAPGASSVIQIAEKDLNKVGVWDPYLCSGDAAVRREAMRVLLEDVRSARVYPMIATYSLRTAAEQAADEDSRREVIDCLIEVAKVNSQDVLYALCFSEVGDIAKKTLASLEPDKAIDDLIAIKERDDRIADIAFEMLATVGGDRALGILTGTLQDANASAFDRRAATEALCVFAKNDPARAQKATQALVTAVSDSGLDLQLRNDAAKTLGEIGSDAAADALYALLKDKDFKFGSVYELLGNCKGAHAAGLVLPDLKSKDYQIRMAAAEALGNIGDDRAAGALFALFTDQYYVASVAAVALGKIGGDRVFTLLRDAIKNKNRDIRQYAAQALGCGKYKQAVDLLVTALKDKERLVRSTAAKALGEIGDGRAAAPLLDAVRINLLDTNEISIPLGELKGDATIDLLIKTLQGPDMHTAAVLALRSIQSPRSVPALIQALKDKDSFVREYATLALCAIKSPDSVEALIGELQSGTCECMYDVVIALGQIGDKQAVEPLISLISPPKEDLPGDLAQRVIDALEMLGDARAVEPLLPLLGNPGFAKHVAETLKTFKDPRAALPLSRLLESEDQETAWRAYEALQGIEPSALVEPLTGILKSPSGQARLYAAVLLGPHAGSETAALFDAAYLSGDAAVVAGAYAYFIPLGKAGSEDLLVQGLDEFGIAAVAEAYYSCGNPKLRAAAEQWAKNRKGGFLPASGKPAIVWGKP